MNENFDFKGKIISSSDLDNFITTSGNKSITGSLYIDTFDLSSSNKEVVNADYVEQKLYGYLSTSGGQINGILKFNSYYLNNPDDSSSGGGHGIVKYIRMMV